MLFPTFVYAQLIDNRDLPPEELRIKPPFIATDRAQMATKDAGVFIILDNADDIRVQEFEDTDTSEAVMLGNVRVRFDSSFLKAEKFIVTIKDSIVVNVGAYGNVELTMSGTKYLTDSLNYQPDMERGIMYNVRSVMDEGSGINLEDKPFFYRAEKVTIQTPTRFVMENVSLSTSDVRFDHYSIKVKKLWYIQGKVALVFGLEYVTGQASFFWLPVFLQVEGSDGLRTSFGNEKRIGYYFINNYGLSSKWGNFDFGFDFYERQGQYFQMEYEAPELEILQNLDFKTSLANDIRSVKNGNLFSQWVDPLLNSGLDGPKDYQRISQFSWYYKLDMTLATSGVSLNIKTEDLNDPYFLSKYSYRNQFDDADSINFVNLLNAGTHSWFGYQGDIQPSLNTIARGFNLSAGNLALSASWELIRVTRPNDENKGNQFLNSYFDYEVRSYTLPSLTYNFGSLDLLKYNYSTKSKITVLRSDGKSNTMNIDKLPEYEEGLTKSSNRSIKREILAQENNKIKTNFITNFTPITVTNVITNEYNWFDISLNASASVSYSSQKTRGTNDSTMTSDPEMLSNTNWTIISDINKHEEQGSLNMNMDLFNNVWSIDNGLSFNYREQWSSFGANYTNSQRDSGLKIDYKVGTSVSPNKIWNDDEWYRTSLNFNTSANYSYPLYYLLRLQTDFVRESQFSWNNTLAWEWLQWQRNPIFGLNLTFNWNLRDRVPTADQDRVIAGDSQNIYIGNRIFDRLTVGAKTRLFWFYIGTEATVDILNTTTNDLANNFRPIAGSSFTNRFVGGYPKLLVEFTPDSKYHYIPKLSYRYNLFEQSRNGVYTNTSTEPGVPDEIVPTVLRADRSFSLEMLWDVRLKNYQIPALYPFIYELSEFGFVLQYYQDFVNVRNSFLRLDFSVGVKFTKYLTFRFSSQMLNNKIHLYYAGGVFNGQPVLAPGETSKEFWGDLGDGLKIWDQDALKRSSFKLQSLSFELIHDLDTWDMRLIFNLGRRVDDVKQIAFWEPYIGVAFTMKGSSAADIFPEFQKRFVPAEYQ